MFVRTHMCVCEIASIAPCGLYTLGVGGGGIAHIAHAAHVLFNTWQLLMSKGSGDLEALCCSK